MLAIIQSAKFRVVAVVIDKAALRAAFGESAAHPYHLGLGFLLQRFSGYLNHINRIGDVMAEARGGTEDLLLRESYSRVYEQGVWGVTSSGYFQSALSSRQLKMRGKKASFRLAVGRFAGASDENVDIKALWFNQRRTCSLRKTSDENR